MGIYQNDRYWSDTLIPQIKRILMPWLQYLASIEIAPSDQDNKEATDFVIGFQGSSIAARIRRPNCKFRDLTIRSHRDNGVETELAKIRKGYASRYFYAWTDEMFTITEWILVDLDKARDAGLFDMGWAETPNRDGTWFISIPIKALRDAKCLIATHRTVSPMSPAATSKLFGVPA